MSSLDVALAAIRNARPRRVVVFTGAGVSADSGIPTFRGAGGLWRNFRAEDLATPEAFARDPALVWEWYEWRRGLIREARPNAAHEAIARLDAVVVTQNVDNLHQRAGAPDVIELHGNIFRVRCVQEGTAELRIDAFPEIPPRCGRCGALLRPDVVWFGESLPDDAVERATSLIRKSDLLLVVGTSGVVYPAAGFVRLHRGLSIEVNPDVENVSTSCRYAIPMTAAAAVPPIVELILEVSS